MRGMGLLAGLSAAVVLAAGCDRNAADVRVVEVPQDREPSSQGEAAGEPAVGTVTETMNAASYTYVQVDTGEKKIWAAAPQFQVKVGDEVTVPAGMPMYDHHSKTLDRDFDVVYFVNSVSNHSAPDAGAQTATEMPAMNPHARAAAAPTEVDVSGIEKPEGGTTIAELYGEKDELADKEVTLRGKVVKFNAQIMGKNWLHVRDGSGEAAEGTHDLTVTTDDAAKVGDTVLVTGELHLARDFGFGYKYDVILEDAQVTVE